MKITSPVFTEAQGIPTRYTCEGEDVSPPLQWGDLPEGAQSLALIVEDPDAPDPQAPKILWIHWVLYNLPVTCQGLAENIAPEQLPAGTCLGLTNWDNTRYGGPCPPIGRHRYFHRLYALDTVLPVLKHPTAEALKAAMKGHILAEAVLMGNYQKKNPA